MPPAAAGLFPDLSKHTIFAAGSPEFVATCVNAVKALGAQDGMIYTEGLFAQQQPTVAVLAMLKPLMVNSSLIWLCLKSLAEPVVPLIPNNCLLVAMLRVLKVLFVMLHAKNILI